MTCKDCLHHEKCTDRDDVPLHDEDFSECGCFCNIYKKIADLETAVALADMVYQFGYDTTFRKQPSVCDGGLSALENAFYALERRGCRMNSNGTITRKNLCEFEERISIEIKDMRSKINFA